MSLTSKNSDRIVIDIDNNYMGFQWFYGTETWMYKIGLPADGRALKAGFAIILLDGHQMAGYERETGGIFWGYHIYSKKKSAILGYTWTCIDMEVS